MRNHNVRAPLLPAIPLADTPAPWLTERNIGSTQRTSAHDCADQFSSPPELEEQGWLARDMKGRPGEYLDRLLAREIGLRKRQSARDRHWKPEELQAWKERMDRNRDGRDEPRRIGRS